MNNQNRKSARVSRPERFQVEMQLLALDQLLPSDHQARIVWKYVEGLDLSTLYDEIKVSGDSPGRNAIAPEILVSLWLLATIDGIGSSRELDRRCKDQIPYLWILGGVSVNYHTLSDFRVHYVDFLENTLVDSVTSLIESGLVPLETLGQDGMRVRASAGKSSFRRKPTLEKLRQQTQSHVDRLNQERESESARQQGESRRKAAAGRAARERQERIEEALQQHEKLSKLREKRKKGEGDKTRVSTTDPDARNMKMANGGFDPAYNVQFSSDADARIIVGVTVCNAGKDDGQLEPMQQKVASHYGRRPSQVLVDSAYANKGGVTGLEREGTKVVSTVPRSEQLIKHGKDPHARQKGDTDEYANFRERMSLEKYQSLYKQRPSIAEFPNAVCRNRNLRQFTVRGLRKVQAIALWHALAFNFTRLNTLGRLAT